MVKRIVRLSFQEQAVEDFQVIFQSSKKKIRNFPGCHHLELWQDVDKENVFYTYSYWNSTDDLENYRNSDLFKVTWSKTKVLFDDKPRAWTVKGIEYLP